MLSKNGSSRMKPCVQGFAAILLLTTLPLSAVEPPPAPYYSLQIATVSDENSARAAVASVASEPFARAEQRGKAYAIRIGAWLSRAEAQQAYESARARGVDAAVVEITNEKPWLFADAGAAAAEPAVEPVAAPAAEAAPAEKMASAATPATLPESAPAPGVWWRSALASFESIGFADGYYLEGTEGTREVYLPLPPGVSPQRAEVVLDLHFGESLIAESSIKISLNDTTRRTVRRADAGSGNQLQVNLPLSARDLLENFVKVKFDYTQLIDRDICFSRELAGAYTRINAGSGLAVLAGDAPPTSVRAAWSLLPEQVVISADFTQLTAVDFQALFQLATLLNDDQRKLRFEHLPANTGLDKVHGHIVLGTGDQLKQWGVSPSSERLPNANLRLVSAETPATQAANRERRVFIFVDRAQSLPAVDMLRMPWRRASGARLLDVAKATEWPPAPSNPETVRLEDLGFADSERRFTYATDWKIGLPFGPLGNGNRPERVQLIVYAPTTQPDRPPTVLSAYYNDRLVFSGALHGKSEAQTLGFQLPRHLLRARNRLQLMAQRDEIADQCRRVQAAQPISVSPSSPITLKPITETPETFAELIPHQRTLHLYAGSDVLKNAPSVIPALVSLGEHFWPDVPAPAIEFFEPGAVLNPASHFFVVGDPQWKPEAAVRFDQGRVRLLSNATLEEALALDVASDTGWALLQMVRNGDYAGAWLKTGAGYNNLPSKRVLFEDENVALLDHRGVQMGLRVGAARDYEVQYPDATGWFQASDRLRTVLFVLLWVLGAALIVYLLRQSRRHRAG